MQRDRAVFGQSLGMPEWQHVFDTLSGQTRAGEQRGALRAENFAVRGEVIEVRMRHERARRRKMRVEMPPDLRQPDAVAEFDVPRHGETDWTQSFARSKSGPERSFLDRINRINGISEG